MAEKAEEDRLSERRSWRLTESFLHPRTIRSRYPLTEKEQRKRDRVLAGQGRRYYARLEKPGYPVPTLIKLMLFRMGRTKIRLMLDDSSRDYAYYTDKGCSNLTTAGATDRASQRTGERGAAAPED